MGKIRISKLSLFLFIISFILLNMLTGSFESPSCGNDEIGFPFRFFQHLGGKRSEPIYPPYTVNYSSLILDILSVGILSVLLENLIRKIKSSFRKKS